jgi:uncharacterized protein (DUF362 family)/Pyruvate/2-oxoacid:ferredoxin oxidoreductase delta subunit
MNKVHVVKCPDHKQVGNRMTELFELMGGIERSAAPGEKIVLKVNLLAAAEPEEAITTHPAVTAAVGKMAKAMGAIPIIADSPGSGFQYTEGTLKRVYRKCGMYDAATEAGIDVNMDTSYQAVSFPDGALAKRLDVITPITKADSVFNLCKLKTHTYMRMIGAVKNHFGVIPGLAKPGYHAKLHDTERFADMLLDLSAYVAPRVSIMDAVIGMEGDGPNAGEPRAIGLLLAACNPLALDVVASEIIGLPREHSPVLVAAERRGLSPTRLEQVELVGADAAGLRIPGYRLPATFAVEEGLANLPRWQQALKPLFRNGLTIKPRVLKDKCIACGACRDACPMHVITIKQDGKKYAHIDDSACIRCYCCHEMCPQDAIELHRSLLYRIINA